MALKKIPMRGYYFEVPSTHSIVGDAASLVLKPASADVTVSKSVKVKPLKKVEGGKGAELQSKIGELEANLKAAESESETLKGQVQTANDTAEKVREEMAAFKATAEENERELGATKKALLKTAEDLEALKKAAKKGK